MNIGLWCQPGEIRFVECIARPSHLGMHVHRPTSRIMCYGVGHHISLMGSECCLGWRSMGLDPPKSGR